MGTYRGMATFLALLMILVGLWMLSFTLFEGGGVGILLGALFIAAGAGRLWLLRRRP